MDADALRLRFGGELIVWRGPSPYHFVRVPPDGCADIRVIAPLVTYGWGVIPVLGRIGSTDFETSLFPKDGGYLVPIKDVIRVREGLAAGDDVEVDLTIRIRA